MNGWIRLARLVVSLVIRLVVRLVDGMNSGPATSIVTNNYNKNDK